MAQTRSRGRPRDPNLVVRRRGEILSAAALMFAEQGYRTADLQILADRLGIGKGTLYRYFATKRDLFLACVDRAMRRLKESVESSATSATDPLDRIARAVRAYLAFFDAHPDCVELFIQERAEFKSRKKSSYFVHRDANIGPWHDLFRDLIAAGSLRKVPVPRITDVLSDLLYGTIFTNALAGRRKSLETQAHDILDIVFHGIVAHHSGVGPVRRRP